MEIEKILWLEDQYNDYVAYRSALYRCGYIVEFVASVTEVIKKMRYSKYFAYIFDIKVLPGDDKKWIEFDNRKRTENPYFDSYLGLELLYSLFDPDNASVRLDPPIKIDPQKVFVFSVVYDKANEISGLGIPEDQIIYKSTSNLNTLPRVISRIKGEE